MRTDWNIRIALLVLAVLIAVRPGFGDSGGAETARGAELEVLLVVDRTLSMSALDHAGAHSRLEGVREDLTDITEALPNSSFAMITFGKEPSLRLPFTSDPDAVEAAVDDLAREPMLDGVGTKVDRPLELMTEVLKRAEEAHPDRKRVVVFASDGENTLPGRNASFSGLRKYVDEAAVLGYGTSTGGLMPSGGNPPWSVVRDLRTGQDAITRVDEGNLERIAEQMDGDYTLRGGGASLTDYARGLADGTDEPDEETEAKHQLYPWLALLAALLGIVELRRTWDAWQRAKEVARR